ncbi:MAG: DUF2007 domain-containing protein [Acidobacteriia bacterium]|nr:DUF2007 domain-containing protein [Terriglobia bacterium]
MDVTTDDFRRHYAELSDAGLLSVNREQLSDTARQVYDAEVAGRGLKIEAQPESPPVAPDHEKHPDEELVQIATFAFPNDAKFARAELEAEGIPCYMGNERTLDVDWFLTNVLGGYKLSVPAADAERARAILDSRVSDEELDAQAAAEPPPEDVV